MNKTILLCGVAIAFTAVPAAAQNAPVQTRNFCTGGDTWRLVDDGAPSQWRQKKYYEVGPAPWDSPYDASLPLATCGTAVQQVPLKCINQKGETTTTNACSIGSANALADYDREHPGWTSRKVSMQAPYRYEATRTTEYDSCDKRVYVWKSTDGSDSSVCGTGQIDVQVDCIDYETKESVYQGYCDASKKPDTKKTVTSNAGCGYDYSTSAWSAIPEASCGQVQQTRSVSCVGTDGQPAPEASCADYLTPPENRIRGGIPTSEFWSKGAYPWPDVGSPNPAGNNIFVWRMPTTCDVGTPDQVRVECEARYVTKVGTHQSYLRPKESRLVSSSTSCPPTPTPTPTGSDDTVTYHWNSPAYVVDKEAVCGPNTKTGRVFCVSDKDGAEVDDALCDASKRPPATLTFEDASGCAPTPTPTPTPTPAPTPVVQEPPPVQTETVPVAVYSGFCRYTSSGGGRHACGYPGTAAQWADLSRNQYQREWKQKGAASPYEMCTGNIIAGDPAGEFVGEYPGPSASPAGKNWSTIPTSPAMKNAKCAVWFKLGYNDNGSQTSWTALYFDGPPTGVQGGHYINKKP
jgi:hypothetical protein